MKQKVRIEVWWEDNSTGFGMYEWRCELPGAIVLTGASSTMRKAYRDIRRRVRANRRLRRQVTRLAA